MEPSPESTTSADYVALLAMKSQITDDPQGALISWNDSLPFCRWQWVTWGHRHQRVTSLNLTGKNLVGALSPFLGNPSFLRNMSLSRNLLYGSIPPEKGRLSRLQRLSLSYNSFMGEIPSNISSCSSLRYIDITRNMLSGKIPNAFSSLLILLGLAVNNQPLAISHLSNFFLLIIVH